MGLKTKQEILNFNNQSNNSSLDKANDSVKHAKEVKSLDNKAIYEAKKYLNPDYQIKSLEEAKYLLELANKVDNKTEIALDEKVLNYLISLKNSADLTSQERQLISEMIKENLSLKEQKNQEIKKLVEEIKPILNKKYTEITSKGLEELLIDNKGHKITFDKHIKDKFSTLLEKKGDFESVIHFVSKDSLLPLNLDLDIYPDEVKEELLYKEVERYSFDVKILTKKGEKVNIYRVGNVGDNKKQIYYSFEKNGQAYLGVLGFNFDWKNGSITNFRVVTKPVEKVLTKKELEKYEDKVYDSGLFDFTGYTIENSTIISDINYMDVGTDEKTYKELKKEFPNKHALDYALKLLGAKIAGSEKYRKYFDIGGLDKEEGGTGDILGVVITKKALEKSGLMTELKNLYETIKNLGLSPYELRKLANDIATYPDINPADKNQLLEYFADYNDSGVIGDEKKAIYDERLVLQMKNLPLSEINKKIDEIISFSGVDPKTIKDIHIKKALFWRGLTNWHPSVLQIHEFFNKGESLTNTIKKSLEIREKFEKSLIERLVGKENAEKFENKINQKYEEFKKKLEKIYGDNLDQSMLARLYNSIHYAGMSAFYVDHNVKKDDMGLGINYKVDWKIIDNLSLGVVRVDNGKMFLGVSVSKKLFEKKFDKNTSISGTIGDANIIYRFATLSGHHNFANLKLEDWTDRAKDVKVMVGTAFPALFGYAGYNFGKKEALEQKKAVITEFLNKLSKDLLAGKEVKLSSEDKKDVIKVNTFKAVKAFLKQVNFDSMSRQEKEAVLSTLMESIKNNYVRLDALSNQGTRLSEVGLIFTPILPLIAFKMEHIGVKYHLSSDASRQIQEANQVLDKSKNLKISDILAKLNDTYPDLKNIAEFKDGKIILDISKIPSAQIAFGDGIQVQRKGNKLIIGGNVNNLTFNRINVAGKHTYRIGFGKDAFVPTADANYSYANGLEIKNGKIISNNLHESKKIDSITMGSKEQHIVLPNEFKQAKEKFESTELSQLIEEGISSRAFAKKGFSSQYDALVRLINFGDVNGAFDYFKNVMLGKRQPLAWSVYDQIGQKKLDELRADLAQVSDTITKRIVIEKVFTKLFQDQYILDKQNYSEVKTKFEEIAQKYGIKILDNGYEVKGKFIPKGQELALQKYVSDKNDKTIVSKWYFANMPLNKFDNSDLLDNWRYNRSAGFMRSIRDEIFGHHTTLNGHLAIHGEKDLQRLSLEAKQYQENGILPDWLQAYPIDVQEKVELLYNILLANNDYLSDFESPTYQTVEAENVIAFPYTYKLSAKQHNHIPMYGVVNLVDKNGDGKFDSSDMEVIDNPEMREYVWSMLTSIFKKSMEKTLNLNENELHQLFIDKQYKNYKLDYKIGLAKWGDCFNTAIILTGLKVNNQEIGISATTGEMFLPNVASVDTQEYWFGLGRKKDTPNILNTSSSSTSSTSGDPASSTSGDSPTADTGGAADTW